jgi:molybdenum cofactor cytidylyltransferase
VAAVIAAVVLAAGGSTRFGRPKQLLPYRGRSLLRHAVDCSIAGGCDPVVVVLGAQVEDLRPELEGTESRVVVNADWQQGLGTSVRAGVSAVQQTSARALLLLACDQPRITPAVVRDLRMRFEETGSRIVASAYAGTIGVPALFDRSLFAELLALNGVGGAKVILQAHTKDVDRVAWPDGAFDIDTPGDYEKLVARGLD